MKKLNKNRPAYGQSYIGYGGVIKTPEKGIDTREILTLDEMREKGRLARQERLEKSTYHNPAETYNSRLYEYPTGQHVTIYDNPIPLGYKNENLSKAYRNALRTEQEEKHCIDVSLSRTKNAIYNIARSNEWQWFITLTLSPDVVDRADYDEVVLKLKIFLSNLQQRSCPDLKYLIVPEFHADGKSYHFHGLLAGCGGLDFTFSGKFDKSGRPVFNIPKWTYGFTTATLVGDTSRASSYITKYVTKESEQYLKNKHRYYTNRNTDRTKPEKLNVSDKNDFLLTYADDISYMKDITVKPAHRRCTYIEMPYGHNVGKSDNSEHSVQHETEP